MAQAYAKVLLSLNVPFEVIGRGNQSADDFTKQTGKTAHVGGIKKALGKLQAPKQAIIAVPIEHLAATATELIEAGVSQVLLEKPGGIDSAQLENLRQAAALSKAQVWLAYNRRFHASTLAAEKAIAEDGGVASVQFEFTEWSHVVAPLTKGPGVKERWLVGNSTHVIDLVFHLCGTPLDWKAWHAGSLPWHPAAARFCGAGVTARGVLFSYLADWEAPGRWGVEVLTRKRRLILRPMEQLQVMGLGSVKIESLSIDDQWDKDFKPGIYRQTLDFIQGNTQRLCSLEQQISNMFLYYRMAGYPVEIEHPTRKSAHEYTGSR